MKKILIPALTLLLIGAACSKTTNTNQPTNNNSASVNSQPTTNSTDQAMADGLQLSNNHCTGTDKPLLTHLPMNAADFNFILPYGLMVGGHVTPVDHQYFSPKNFNSAINAYPVYAMADSTITDIQTRQHPYQGHDTSQTVTDYRIVFSVSCKLFYYYDLVTGLTPDLKTASDQHQFNIPVTAGQLIGYIGSQTLDFAVWDMDSRLSGFIVPDHYNGEAWKIHTVDPLQYETADIQEVTLSKYARTVKPFSGKIDYDVEGQAIGTWFKVGTNGYSNPTGATPGNYWTGHLSLAPYYLDPASFLISIGNWPDGAKQFATKETTPNPADISVTTGLVKYTLVGFEDEKANNSRWDNMSPPGGPIHLGKTAQSDGCFLVQMLDARSLKAEAFKGKSCTSVTSFDANAVMYER